jgi:hypothetical protein
MLGGSDCKNKSVVTKHVVGIAASVFGGIQLSLDNSTPNPNKLFFKN